MKTGASAPVSAFSGGGGIGIPAKARNALCGAPRRSKFAESARKPGIRSQKAEFRPCATRNENPPDRRDGEAGKARLPDRPDGALPRPWRSSQSPQRPASARAEPEALRHSSGIGRSRFIGQVPPPGFERPDGAENPGPARIRAIRCHAGVSGATGLAPAGIAGGSRAGRRGPLETAPQSPGPATGCEAAVSQRA